MTRKTWESVRTLIRIMYISCVYIEGRRDVDNNIKQTKNPRNLVLHSLYSLLYVIIRLPGVLNITHIYIVVKV